MKIFIGADHRGFFLKEKVEDFLRANGYDFEDVSGEKYDPNDDFPVFAHRAVAKILTSDDADPRAILLCGGAQGMGSALRLPGGLEARRPRSLRCLPCRPPGHAIEDG